jgi:CheY-like chemotaxis protein
MPRILLVEDSKINQLLALRMLDKIGFSAECAGNGDAAILRITDHPYDLILMDCQMPGMDGYETTAVIRQLERDAERPGTPIIGVSGVEGGFRAAIDAGMDDALTKPLRIDVLQAAVERWLGAPEPRVDVDVEPFVIRLDQPAEPSLVHSE